MHRLGGHRLRLPQAAGQSKRRFRNPAEVANGQSVAAIDRVNGAGFSRGRDTDCNRPRTAEHDCLTIATSSFSEYEEGDHEKQA